MKIDKIFKIRLISIVLILGALNNTIFLGYVSLLRDNYIIKIATL